MHPYKLAYVMSKNLVVNGVDIYTQIASSRSAYRLHNYYDSGYHFGFAFDELFLKTLNNTVSLKSERDLKAYKFISGFFSQMNLVG